MYSQTIVHIPLFIDLEGHRSISDSYTFGTPSSISPFPDELGFVRRRRRDVGTGLELGSASWGLKQPSIYLNSPLNIVLGHWWSCFDRQSLNVTVVQLPPGLSTYPWNIPLSCFRSVFIQNFLPLKTVKSLVEVMGPPHAASNGELAAPLIGAMIASAFVTLLLASLFSLIARSSTGCTAP